jgi:hypothetical protein
LKPLLIGLTALLVGGNACAASYTYRVILPDRSTELIRSDDGGVARLQHIRDFSYVSKVGHISRDDWQRLDSNKQLPKYDVSRCDDTTCWYGTHDLLNLGDEIEIRTSMQDAQPVSHISIVHSFIEESHDMSAPGQLIPLLLPTMTTLSTRTATPTSLNQPVNIDTPEGNVVITLIDVGH